jgi:6-phosphogluconate dehydrogenase
MQLGLVGLGRMGANIARRLMRAGHTCVVFDTNLAAGQALMADGPPGAALACADLAALVQAMPMARGVGDVASGLRHRTGDCDVGRVALAG